MDGQLKALLEDINALKSGQEDMQRRQEEMKKGQEETKNELKDRIEKGQEETKQEMQKRLEDMQKGQERMQKSLKVEEKVAVVEEKIEKKVEQVEERIREQVEEKYEEVPGNFSLISQRVEELEKKLLVSGNKDEDKILPSSPVPVSSSPVPVTASTVGVAAEILQTLPDTERLNLNSLYNALDLRFSQKYSKDYARLQMKTRLQKTGESMQEYASEVERFANLAFSDHPATVRETISLQYFVDGLREGEVQKAVRMTDVQDLKSALKVEAANEASCRDSHSVRGARVTTDAPCESPWRKEIEKLRKEIQDLMAQRQNLRRRRITCWGCGRTGHLRSNCPRVNQEDPCGTSVTESKKVCSNRKGSDENGDVRSKRPCSESSKNLSNSLGVKKKFGVIDPVVRQVTTPSTSALDPWSDESVRKDQLADPEIKPIIKIKESSDEKPSWQDISPLSILQRSVTGLFGTLSI
ncbi:uncharacterized protein TNCV_4001801 [Trichonephila clavipes]|uniref:CCHC-type domain-containing protein n=1 Tax=Trichonephila clavipes TaxID=2585209 RepID=A0A8X6RMV7_TRICX|nr:uncharacterized protein TNCV_4001801 [Trichonephila clavipes]